VPSRCPVIDVTSCDVMLKPLDVIELRVAVDAWEAGTVATVLEVLPGSVLAEVADEDGRTLEVLTVPVDAARPLDLDGVSNRPETSQDVPRRPVPSTDVPERPASGRLPARG
jgi:hypothetical protein